VTLLYTYDPVLFSRLLTSLTLAFHIIFATIGVGVPLYIGLAEWIGIRKNDFHYILLARRWSRGYVITVAVGVVTGTAIGLQLSLLWPSFMQVAGQSIALPLFMETFAFFFEAIFLGIYLYTWDRFKNRKVHLLLLIPVVIGSGASAVFITIVNAFMNYPVGFTYENGLITDVNPIQAMLSPAVPTKISHVLTTAYLTCGLVLAAIAAFAYARGQRETYHRKALKFTMICTFVFMIATVIIGDLSGKYLAVYQPEKLAATEWHFETATHAPLILGGVLQDDYSIKYGLKIPYGLSILAFSNPSAEVVGLDQFAEEHWAPLWVHYIFDMKMGLVAMLTIITFLFIIELIRKKGNIYRGWLLALVVAAAPIAMLTIEHGWIFSEVGRQPWIVRGIMTTTEGATRSDHVDLMLLLFFLLYTVLGVSSIRVLTNMFKKNKVADELALYKK